VDEDILMFWTSRLSLGEADVVAKDEVFCNDAILVGRR
jgi:hypothetical protein